MTDASCPRCRQELAAAIATDGLLPLTREDMPPAFAALLKACWSLQPSHRPSAQQMLQSLQDMQTDVTDPGCQEAVAAQASDEQGTTQLASRADLSLLLAVQCDAHMSHALHTYLAPLSHMIELAI